MMSEADELIFHQVLAWHHFYDRSTPAVALMADVRTTILRRSNLPHRPCTTAVRSRTFCSPSPYLHPGIRQLAVANGAQGSAINGSCAQEQ
jgi:hypothetical protein